MYLYSTPLKAVPSALSALTVNRLRSAYWLKSFDSPRGRAFELRKFREGTTYHVLLSDGQHTCDCPAGCFGRSRSCEHRDAMADLVARGMV